MLPGRSLVSAQSIDKLEAKAINRTRITVLHGDTVEVFDITPRRPGTKPKRVYHWYAQDQINRSTGDYQGKLLHGSYRRLDRAQHLLASGTFEEGTKTGRWNTYGAGGALATSSEWHDGEQRGKTVYHTADGNQPHRRLCVPFRPPIQAAAVCKS